MIQIWLLEIDLFGLVLFKGTLHNRLWRLRQKLIGQKQKLYAVSVGPTVLHAPACIIHYPGCGTVTHTGAGEHLHRVSWAWVNYLSRRDLIIADISTIALYHVIVSFSDTSELFQNCAGPLPKASICLYCSCLYFFLWLVFLYNFRSVVCFNKCANIIRFSPQNASQKKKISILGIVVLIGETHLCMESYEQWSMGKKYAN